MKKALLAMGLFLVFFAASSFGLHAQQTDLKQMARDLTAKSEADRAAAYALAAANGWPVRGTGQDGSFFELQRVINGMPRYYSTFNANAAISTRADSVNALIGGGTGFVLRLWDGGKPLTTHRELIGRVTWADPSPGTVAGHATHVAGTMIASGIQAGTRGMSYAATIRAFEWSNDAGEMASEAASGANLSNHSYGYIAGWYFDNVNWFWYGDTAVSQVEDYSFGFYDSYAQMYDNLLNSAQNYLPVVSASNDRDDYGPAPGTKHYYWDDRYGAWRFSTKTRNADGTPTGYDCIPFGFQISKNTLTVGAVNDVPSYTGPGSVVLAAFSSTGPCDDGRIKPDLVGNGVSLLSSYSSHDSSYATASGTSMASPNVSGSLGLLADYYRDTHGGTAMWASTLKALAIHTALEAGANPGPDYQYGWGLLNTMAAYRLLNKDYLNDAKGLIEQLTLANGQTLEYWYRVPAGTTELRATICWNDPAGNPPAPSLDPATRMLVNDLDLRSVKGVDTYYPWRLDRFNPSNAATKNDNIVDNVEQVVVTAPAAGVYAIRITHKGTLGSAQKVSLVVSGAERNHVWHVYANGSGDAPTIAAAVAGAVDGDSIYVHQGTYPEAGISVGKALVIIGVDGAALTTIDGNGLGLGVFTFPAVSKVIVVRGFTIKSGSSSILGGGVNCSNSSVTVDHCVFEDCHATYYGGGMAVINASPAIANCAFLGNSAGYDGGGVYLSSSTSVFDSCVFHGNTAVGAGGGIGVLNATPQFRNCTVNANAAGTNGGGVFIGASGNPTLTRCLITSNTSGGGIYGAVGAVGATITCCDVFGNGVNYGGTISDRTGIDNNISRDPLYCGPGASPPALTIATLSPCASAASPCAQLIGALGVGCVMGADLVITNVQFNDTSPAFGDSIRATVTLKNAGELPAENFYADYYVDSDAAPPAATPGDQRLLVVSLAAGDSIVWVTDYEKASVFKSWSSWFSVDTDMAVLETNEANNMSGPHAILWRFRSQALWPAAIGYGFHSSPAIVNLDGDEANTLETVIGCDDGKIHVLTSGGTELAGWPATVGDTLYSSPAVGDIAGDSHREVVIGGRDGKIYAFDYQGTKLWEYATGAAILTTPALADIDRDTKCEVLCGAGTNLYALEGNGTICPGSWPYSAGAGSFTSPAVGDVDGDGALEIAVIASKAPDTLSSMVHLVKPNGASYSLSWPATVDTVVVADPVLGDVDGSTPELEIVSGGINGAVYVWKTDGTLWAAPPRVPGAIETSSALADLDADGSPEIIVTSRLNIFRDPPGGLVWETAITAVDNNGTIIAGWPAVVRSSIADAGPSPSAIVIGSRRESIEGNPSRLLSSWGSDGAPVYGFPLDLSGDILTSAAAGDIDNDGKIELVTAASDTSRAIYCYELIEGFYATDALWWPMFRYDPARTGCYGFVAPTGVDENPAATPKVTALRSIYPNPFNPTTRIAFDIGARSRVELAIYDASGRRIAGLVNGDLEAGAYTIAWNGRADGGRAIASGIYFCRLKAGSVVETKKLVLLR